jgi:RNA polymerase sigma-70 factor (ECF subfamily)
MVLLGEQDRGLWDRSQIAGGLALCDRALARGPAGRYTLQAAIAAEHARATHAGQTDWPRIASLYGLLGRVQPSPVVTLNRAVAVAMSEGPAAGLELADEVAGELDGYAPLHSTRAELLNRMGRAEDAAAAYTRALGLASNPVLREFLQRRLRGLNP